MRDVGFEEDVTNRLKTKEFVERDCVRLSMQAQLGESLAFGFFDDLRHEIASVSFATFGGKRQHTADTQHFFISVGKQTCVSNNLSIATKGEMGGDVIDIIFIKVRDALFDSKNGITRLEYLVDIGGREV